MTEETAAVFSTTPIIVTALVTLAVYVVCRVLDKRGLL